MNQRAWLSATSEPSGAVRQQSARQCVAAARPDPGRRDCLHCDVRHLALCGALADDELVQLNAIMSPLTLSPGRILFHEGDRADHVYSVAAGTLRLVRLLPDGRRQITGFAFPGDFLGLSASGIHPYTAEAVDTVEICRFPAAAMRELLDRRPPLERRLVEMRGDDLIAVQDRILLLGRMKPVEKLASFLLEMSTRQQRRGWPGDPVRVAMPRGDIADYLGLTVETVSRSFTQLKRSGIIALPDPATARLLDRPRLEALAAGY